MRHSVIDPTRTWSIAHNPFGDDPQGAGFYVAIYCPIDGYDIIPSQFDTRAEALDYMEEIMAEMALV